MVGMNQLSKLNSNWVVEQVTQSTLRVFVQDARSIQEDTSMMDFMTDSINKSLECSIKTHNTAKIYVELLNGKILKPFADLQRYKNDCRHTN